MTVDIDNDSKADWKFIVNHKSYHWPAGGGCGSYCDCDQFSAYIERLSESVLICAEADGQTIKLAKDERIDTQKNWKNIAVLLAAGPQIYKAFNFAEGYVGVKVGDRYGWLLISLVSDNGVAVKEYALNLAPGNAMRAGQTQ